LTRLVASREVNTTRGALKINWTASFVILHSILSLLPPGGGWVITSYILSLLTYLFSLAVGTDSNFLPETVPRWFILKTIATDSASEESVTNLECPRVRVIGIITCEAKLWNSPNKESVIVVFIAYLPFFENETDSVVNSPEIPKLSQHLGSTVLRKPLLPE
jgi:hypothetical protein